jgi:5-methylcytosine-specific restriction protein A
MASRKDEIMDFSGFTLGNLYSKKEIAELGKLSPPDSPYDFGGFTPLKNAILMFINLERKDPLPHQTRVFENQLDGDMLYTDSQPSNTKSSPIIKRLTQPNEDVRVFVRLSPKVDNKVQSFCYFGRIQCKDHYGEKPIRFHWELLDFPNLHENSNYLFLSQAKPPTAAITSDDNTDLQDEYIEGSKKRVLANRYERDIIARQMCIQLYGANCWVCNFNFSDHYGTLGSDFIIVHHRIPISVRAKKGKYELDPARDLVPLCANCHSMVHRKGLHQDKTGEINEDEWNRLLELRNIALLDEWEKID